MSRTLLCALFGLWLAASALPAGAEFRYRWEDTFSAAEQDRLTAWIDETRRALERLVGPLPFDVEVRFQRRDGAAGPVPWAHTTRGRRQGVSFHVDPGFALDAFRRDWTAAHELSHLVLPYLGRSDAWFAEGFASYMQYPVMQAMGTLSAAEARSRLRRNLARAADDYPYPDRPFALAAGRLKEERRFPTLYWGGAAFFLQADAALRAEADTTLLAVLVDYLACCRADRARLEALAAELDQVAGRAVFVPRLGRFRTVAGFPEYRGLIPE